MDPQEFMSHLNQIRELMIQESYKNALPILEKLKEIEKKGDNDYSYNLVHQLYQLDSNCRSGYNQQIILEKLISVSTNLKSITLDELNHLLREDGNLIISNDILRREVELLILRNLIACKIEENILKF
ncbi:MAG: hypothetical protein ACXABO_10735 [Promethearchaeota archaeon]|jgi:hypothetical protein